MPPPRSCHGAFDGLGGLLRSRTLCKRRCTDMEVDDNIVSALSDCVDQQSAQHYSEAADDLLPQLGHVSSPAAVSTKTPSLVRKVRASAASRVLSLPVR